MGIYVSYNIRNCDILFAETNYDVEQIWVRIKIPGKTFAIDEIYKTRRTNKINLLNYVENVIFFPLLNCMGDLTSIV